MEIVQGSWAARQETWVKCYDVGEGTEGLENEL